MCVLFALKIHRFYPSELLVTYDDDGAGVDNDGNFDLGDFHCFEDVNSLQKP